MSTQLTVGLVLLVALIASVVGVIVTYACNKVGGMVYCAGCAIGLIAGLLYGALKGWYVGIAPDSMAYWPVWPVVLLGCVAAIGLVAPGVAYLVREFREISDPNYGMPMRHARR